MLRALADLVEKEAIAPADAAAASCPATVRPAPPEPAATQAARPTAVPTTTASESRKRLVVPLSNVSAIEAAKALREFLAGEQNGQLPGETLQAFHQVAIVPEPITNRLLVGGPPQLVDSLMAIVASLDAPPETVMVDLCIAEFRVDGDSSPEKEPSLRAEGAAWLAWAEKQGRLEVLSRPKIMTMENQSASIMIGSLVPTKSPPSVAAGADKIDQIECAEVGLTVDLTPRLAPDGLIITQLNIERSSVDGSGTGQPVVAKTSLQTTLSAVGGQTVVLAGPTQRVADSNRRLIIALTPSINPQR